MGTCRLENFAISADPGMKIKESKKNVKYLELSKEQNGTSE